MTDDVDRIAVRPESKRTWHPIYGNSFRSWLEAEAPEQDPPKARNRPKRTLVRRK